AGQAFEQSLVEERVIVASDGIPAARHRPLSREIDLPQQIALETIAGIDQLGDLRRVAQADAEALEPMIVRIVLGGRVEGDARLQAAADRGEQIGLPRGPQGGIRRQRHALVAEIKAFADGGSQELLAVLLQKAAGERKGRLVRVAEAIAADEAV